MQPNCITFFIMKLHSVIYNQLSAEAYRPMLRDAWQNDIGEPVDNFIDVAFSIDIIECAVMTCDHFAFLHCAFCSHSYCFEHFTEKSSLVFIVNISALRVASTMTHAVRSKSTFAQVCRKTTLTSTFRGT